MPLHIEIQSVNQHVDTFVPTIGPLSETPQNANQSNDEYARRCGKTTQVATRSLASFKPQSAAFQVIMQKL